MDSALLPVLEAHTYLCLITNTGDNAQSERALIGGANFCPSAPQQVDPAIGVDKERNKIPY